MERLRWHQLTLRTAAAITLVGSSVADVVAFIVILTFSAVSEIYEARQDTFLNEFTSAFHFDREWFPDDWTCYTDVSLGPTAFIDLQRDRAVGELDRSEAPPDLDRAENRTPALDVRIYAPCFASRNEYLGYIRHVGHMVLQRLVSRFAGSAISRALSTGRDTERHAGAQVHTAPAIATPATKIQRR